MGLNHWLAQLPSGTFGKDLSMEEVAAWIRRRHWDTQGTADERVDYERRAHNRKLHEFFEGRGNPHMRTLIEKVFTNPEVKKLRKDWVAVANHTNVLHRLTVAQSTTYSLPAKRTVAGKDDNRTYQQLQRMARQDDFARRWCQWGNLHKQLLVGYRVRETTREGKQPVIDVVPPHRFFVVTSPIDETHLLAVGIQLGVNLPRKPVAAVPAWLVVTDVEEFFLDGDGHYIAGSYRKHGWSRMPWVLLSTEPPPSGLLDLTPSSNEMAAHEAVWFQHILLAKESKSATKTTVFTGDVNEQARGQALDTEAPVEAGDAVAEAVDMSMDLEMFRSNATYIYEGTAADNNLPPQLLHHAGVQSAEAHLLMRAPLMEERRKQEIYWREFERQYVEVQSMVNARDMPDYAFSTEGWKIDYTESVTPLDPKTALEVFEQSRRLGLTNTAQELMRRNPDLLTDDDALEIVRENVAVELVRNMLMRPLQVLSGESGNPRISPIEVVEDDESSGAADQRAQVPPTLTGVRSTTNGR